MMNGKKTEPEEPLSRESEPLYRQAAEYPEAKVVGHRDLSPDLNGNGEVEPMEWTKECPCFKVREEGW